MRAVAKSLDGMFAASQSHGLNRLQLTPTAVNAGESSIAVITLDRPAPLRGAVVQISSNHVNAVVVPTAATVPAREVDSSFNVESLEGAILVDTPVSITASYLGSTRSATLLVKPPSVRLVAVRLERTVVGGDSVRGTIELNGPAPEGGIVVNLSTRGAFRQLATPLPQNVNIPAGRTAQRFTLETREVAEQRNVTVVATLHDAENSVTLRIVPRP